MKRIGIAVTALLAATVVVFAATAAQAATPSLPTTGAVDTARYIPKDSAFLITINVGKLAETGLFETLAQMGGEGAFEEMEALGIDPAEDIKQVMLGVVVNEDDIEEEPEVYIAMAGDFPEASTFIEAYKEEEGEEPESRKVKGETVYTFDEVDVCFLKGIILLAPMEDVEADIGKMLAGVENSVTRNTVLTGLMAGVNTKATVWGVANLPEALREMMGEDAEDAPFDISALKTVAGSFDYADKVKLDVGLGFTDEDAASGLVDVWNTQIKPMGDMMKEQMPPLADLINAMSVKASGKKATLNFEMGQEDFNAAVEAVFGMMFGAMMGGMDDGGWDDDGDWDDDDDW
jgi:hypothetical protein